MYNDPTESYKQVELMQAVYHTPYEAAGLYGGDEPPGPPTPSKERHLGLLVGWVSLLCGAMLLCGVIMGVLLASGLHTVTHLPPTPTFVPTATPVPPISSTASAIYHEFSAHGLGGTNLKVDTNWRCCTYAPEGGALVWIDRTSGHSIDLAAFKSVSEAESDARQLSARHFASTVVHTCLLSYDKAVPPGVLSRYVHVMHTYCH